MCFLSTEITDWTEPVIHTASISPGLFIQTLQYQSCVLAINIGKIICFAFIYHFIQNTLQFSSHSSNYSSSHGHGSVMCTALIPSVQQQSCHTHHSAAEFLFLNRNVFMLYLTAALLANSTFTDGGRVRLKFMVS